MTKKAKRVHGKSTSNTTKGATKATDKVVSAKKIEIAARPVRAGVINEPAHTTAPKRPDARLPSVGTTLVKRDRGGAPRCECTIEADGYRYKDTVYRSITAAARAAASDLGISTAVNGLVFWGVVCLLASALVVVGWRRYRRAMSELERARREMRAEVESLRELLQDKHLNN